MSRLITNSIRSTSASADAITFDNSGKPAFPNGGAGKILQVKSISKLDSFSQCSPTAGQYYDVTGLDNLQITTTGSNKVIVFMF